MTEKMDNSSGRNPRIPASNVQDRREKSMRRKGIRMRFYAPSFVGIVLITGTLFGHHSIAATYFSDKTEQITGKIVTLIYRNPHSFVEVEARDEEGRLQTWAIEWAASSQLNLLGGKGGIKPGDSVVVIGNPGRNSADHRLRMVSITRTSDGWKWSERF
jgi:uncharacterized protein DUF6152